MNTQLVESLVQVIRALSADEQALLQQKLQTELPQSLEREAENSSIDSSESSSWATLTADQFLAGYSPVDAIYDEL
jgi:hypothetical protein